LSSVIVVVLGFRLCLDNPTLPKITAVAADPSATSYTTPWDTTPVVQQVERTGQVPALPRNLRQQLGDGTRPERVDVLGAALQSEDVRGSHHDIHLR